VVLLKKGAKMNSKTNDGFTPLHYACGYGLAEMTSVVQSVRADVLAEYNYGSTPLQDACKTGFAKLVVALLEKGAGVNVKTNEGWSSLH